MRRTLCAWLVLVLLACPSLGKAFNHAMADQICIGDAFLPPIFKNGAPIPIGCELVDCCPGCPAAGPLELRVEVDAKVLAGADLRMEGMSSTQLRSLKIEGNAKVDGNRIVLGRGVSRIRGVPYKQGAPAAVAVLQPRIPGKSARQPSGNFRAVTDQILVKQLLGPVTVNLFQWDFFIRPCFRPSNPPPTSDQLKIQGIAIGDDVVVMMDAGVNAGTSTECHDGVGEAEWLFKSTGTTAFPNNLVPLAGCNSEIAIFSKKHAMKWETAVPWTNSLGDVHTVTLDPIIKPDVNIWVVDEATRIRAQQHFDTAKDLYINNRVGVEFVPHIQILSSVPGAPADAFNIVKSGITANGVECLGGIDSNGQPFGINKIQGQPFYVAKTLNIYYVDQAFTGKNCAIKPTPGICSIDTTAFPPGDANITYVGTGATETTLAHEIGHAYGLRSAKCHGHTDGVPGFSASNIMFTGGSVPRTSFTPGQVFRMNTHIDVWGGTMLIPNNIPGRTPRNCMPNSPPSDLCPLLEVPWPP